MDPGNHPDPFSEAMSHGLQRAVQVASSVMTGAQVYVHLKRTQARVVSERDERARRALAAQITADGTAARVGWEPALDAGWLQQAGLFRTAQAWGAAMPYADRAMPWYEPAAATAMRKCEERLRVLHPRAMARYDRLRGEGTGPAEAMREAAPLFGQPPSARDAPYQARPVLDAGNGETLAWSTTGPGTGPGEPGSPVAAATQERRGRQIIEALQSRARAHGRDPLGEAEQRTVLETITNLPADLIDQLVRPDTAAQGTAAGQAPANRLARPWQHDFPIPVRDVVASAAGSAPTTAQPAAAAPARQAVSRSHPRP
jgi:hypothetical protein